MKPPPLPCSLLFALASLAAGAEPLVRPNELATGPFQPADDSLAAYQCPDWFRDAKFGIWSHWGPQAVPREGDWYARGLYENTVIDRKTGEKKGQGRQNKYHLEHYGHPSKFGYKDIIPLWKAERLDPGRPAFS